MTMGGFFKPSMLQFSKPVSTARTNHETEKSARSSSLPPLLRYLLFKKTCIEDFV
jgi:hypothetical protein